MSKNKVIHVSRSLSSRRITAHELDAKEKAALLVADAETRAAERLEQAELIADEVRRLAEEQGRESAELEAATLIVEAARIRDAALQDRRSQLVELALRCAHELVRAELTLAPEKIELIAEHVLEGARRAHEVELRVHPSEVSYLADLRGVRVLGDERLTPGDCVVSSELGVLDGRLTVRIEAIKKALLADD